MVIGLCVVIVAIIAITVTAALPPNKLVEESPFVGQKQTHRESKHKSPGLPSQLQESPQSNTPPPSTPNSAKTKQQ
jgi:hypothetical protein